MDKHYYMLIDSEGKEIGVGKNPVTEEAIKEWLKKHPGYTVKKVAKKEPVEAKPNRKEVSMQDNKRRVSAFLKKIDKGLTHIRDTVPEEPLPLPKFANFLCKVTHWAKCVPEEDRKQEDILRSAQAAYADYIMRSRLKEGQKMPHATRHTADGRTFVIPWTPIKAAQIYKDLDGCPGMTRVEVAFSILDIIDELLATGHDVIGWFYDLILYIPKKYKVFSNDYLAMRDRLKAGTLLTENGPAINTWKTHFVDEFKGMGFDTAELEKIVDGGCWGNQAVLEPEIPAELLPIKNEWTKDDLYTMGGRVLTLDSTECAELAKFNMAMLNETMYTWLKKNVPDTEEDSGVLMPSITMKNYRGAGVRKMVYQWLTGAYITKKAFTLEKVSLGEHMSSTYTKETLELIQEHLKTQVEKLNVNLATEEACRRLIANIKPEDLDMILSSSDEDEEGSKKMGDAKRLVTNARDWAEHRLPLYAIGTELVPFFVKAITNALALRDRVLTIKGYAYPVPLAEGIHAQLPHYLTYPKHMMGNEPEWMRPFIKVYSDCYRIDLMAATLHRGFIIVKRTPVVNGKFLLLPEEIEWMMHSQACRFSKSLTFGLNADYDGDFFKFSFNWPVEHVDIDEWADRMRDMSNKLELAVETIAKGDDKLPKWNEVADSNASIKQLCASVENKGTPGGKLAAQIVRSLAVKKLVGPSTNADNDCKIQQHSAIVRHPEGMMFIGATSRMMSEGPIHLIKHPDTVVPLGPDGYRRHFGTLLQMMLDINIKEVHTGVLPHERMARTGIKLDRIRMPHPWEIPADGTISEQYDAIHTGVEDLLAEKRENAAAGNGYKSDRYERVLTPREQIIYLKIYEHLHLNELHPVMHKAVPALNLNMDWALTRDTEFDGKVKELMPVIVDVEKKQTSAHGRELSMFYGMFDNTGKINWDKNNAAGELAYRYFIGGRDINNEIVAVLRKLRAIAPVYVVLASLYTDALGVSVPSILRDGFTNAELHAARRLIDMISMDSDTITIPAEDMIETKHGELWVKREAPAASHDKFQQLYMLAMNDEIVDNMKDFRRLLCIAQRGKEVRVLPNGSMLIMK